MVGAGVVRLNKFHQFSCLTWPFNLLVPIKFIQLPSTSGFKESNFMISVLLLRCLFGTFNALVMHLVTNNHELDAYVLSLIFRRWKYDEDGTMSYDSDSLLYSDAISSHLSRPLLLQEAAFKDLPPATWCYLKGLIVCTYTVLWGWATQIGFGVLVNQLSN